MGLRWPMPSKCPWAPCIIYKGRRGKKKGRNFYIYPDVTHTHTCSEISYRITDVECIGRAKTLQLNLTGEIGWHDAVSFPCSVIIYIYIQNLDLTSLPKGKGWPKPGMNMRNEMKPTLKCIYKSLTFNRLEVLHHLLRNNFSNDWCGMHRTCKTTSAKTQVRLHGSRGGVFVGHRPPRDPGGPLLKVNVKIVVQNQNETWNIENG